MSAKFDHENWLKILEAAREQDTPGESPHPVDDDGLLNRWSMGDLDAQEQNSLMNHLAHCSDCRMIVVSMLKTGSLELPEVKIDSQELKPLIPEHVFTCGCCSLLRLWSCWERWSISGKIQLPRLAIKLHFSKNNYNRERTKSFMINPVLS